MDQVSVGVWSQLLAGAKSQMRKAEVLKREKGLRLYEGGFQFKKRYFGPKPGELRETNRHVQGKS